MTGGLPGYQYVVLRCVPRADREEFVNVGVVLYSQSHDFLGCAGHVDEDRLRALSPGLDVAAVRSALEAAHRVCAGEGPRMPGATGQDSLGVRFGFLSAPAAPWCGQARSTAARRRTRTPSWTGCSASWCADEARAVTALGRRRDTVAP